MTPRIPGVTAENPAYRPIRATHWPIILDHLQGILAAGGGEPAIRPQQGAQGDLIQPNQAHQDRGDGSAQGLHPPIVVEFSVQGKWLSGRNYRLPEGPATSERPQRFAAEPARSGRS